MNPMAADPRYQLTLVNELAELRRMSAWLNQAGCELGISPERIAELEVCANEAVTNIISYAYDAPGSREIALHLVSAGDGASLTIEDDGRAFDPLAAPLPAAPASLAAAAIGGLGIKLMRSMMADCAYRRSGGKNLFTLTTHP